MRSVKLRSTAAFMLAMILLLSILCILVTQRELNFSSDFTLNQVKYSCCCPEHLSVRIVWTDDGTALMELYKNELTLFALSSCGNISQLLPA